MFAFFIDRPVLSNVLAMVLVLLGGIAFYSLPVEQYPNIAPPTVQVVTAYPGASAETVAETVALPLEQAVNGVEGMIYMESTSASNGGYTLTVTFAIGTNIDLAQVLVQNRMATASPLLPAAVNALGVVVQKTSTAFLQIASLTAPDGRYDGLFLSNYATISLLPELQRLQGVGNIVVFGAGLYSMRVWLDPDRLYTYGLVPQDVVTAILNQNQQVSAGQVGMPPASADQSFQLNIKLAGRLSNVAQFRDIIVKADPGDGGRLVRLGDVARVELGAQSYAQQFRVDGKQAAGIAIFQTPEANALEVSGRVRSKLAELSASFPAGMAYGIPFDASHYIEVSVAEVYRTLTVAGVLVLIVMLLFLQDWRVVLVPATTIPVTIIGAFAAIAVLGFTINLLTLFAIVLAIGIVVDDAIVIVEDVVRRLERGVPRREACVQSMTELAAPILGITLVLMAVFIPASFLGGITGRMFAQFALVIAATAFLSALNAATLKPTQCALWLRPPIPPERRNFFFRGFNRVYGMLDKAYAGLVGGLTRHSFVTVIAAVALAGLGGWGLSQVQTGFIPQEDQGYLTAIVQLPDGAALRRTEQTVEQAARMALDVPGVARVLSLSGMSMLDSGAALANAGANFVMLKPWHERARAPGQDLATISSRIQTAMSTLEDGVGFVVQPPAVPGIGDAGLAMQVELRDGSFDYAKLQRIADELILSAEAQSGMGPLVTTFRAHAPQVQVDVDRVKAKALGVSMGEAYGALSSYLGSAYVNQFTKFGLNLQVYIQADSAYRTAAPQILNLQVRNEQGQMVPIGALATIKTSVGPPLVSFYNRFPTVAIIGSPAPGFSTGEAMDLLAEAARRVLPPGASYEWTGMSYQERQARGQVVVIFGLTLLLVYLCLAGLFESWLAPFAVILAVPLALIGPYVTLEALGLANDLYTQIGLLLLVALSAKNAILMIRVARHSRLRDGATIVDAAIEGALRRFRPILMTSLTLILSVMPLVLAIGAGANARHSLGLCVMSGMIASTCLAVLFVPSFFCLLQRLEERLRARTTVAAAPPASEGA